MLIKYGVLSYEDMLKNVVLDGGTIKEEKKLNAISVVRNGNNINITANVTIEGELADEEIGDTGKKYSEVAISGINEAWSGKMGNLSIYTKVVVADNSIYKTIKITITESIQIFCD